MNFLFNLFKNSKNKQKSLGECYCGNTYATYGLASINGKLCNSTCSANTQEICGGPYANSIYLNTCSGK